MKFRRGIFWLHLIAGLIVGSVLFVMATTGMIMAFEPQIVDFSEKHLRTVEIPQGIPRLSLDEIAAKASAAKPGAKLAGMTFRPEPSASVIVQFGRDGGTLYMNPYTGAVLGPLSKIHDAMHAIVDIHRKLAAGDTGRRITGICNSAFFFMILSGFYLWWPRNWNRESFTKILRFNQGLKGKARDWNWHNVVGFWCAPFLLITALTGMVMSFGWANNLLFRVTGNEPTNYAAMKTAKPEGGGRPASWDAFAAGIQSKAPHWESLSMRLPKPGEAGVTAFIQEQGRPEFARSKMVLNAADASVIVWEPYEEQNAGRKARAWVKPIHTGEAWGVPGQLLMMVSAFGLLLLVYTGFAMAWRRFFSPKTISIN